MSTPENFEHLPMTTLQCPRCGLQQDVPLVAHHRVALDYAAVCTSPIPTGGRCGTSLRLTATSHVHPAP
jgi:hypothetical protein